MPNAREYYQALVAHSATYCQLIEQLQKAVQSGHSEHMHSLSAELEATARTLQSKHAVLDEHLPGKPGQSFVQRLTQHLGESELQALQRIAAQVSRNEQQLQSTLTRFSRFNRRLLNTLLGHSQTGQAKQEYTRAGNVSEPGRITRHLYSA